MNERSGSRAEGRFLGLLSPEELAACIAMGSVANRPAGSELVDRAADQRALSILLSGTAEVRRDDGVILATLSAGDVFGEMSFVSGERPSAAVVALRDVTVLRLTLAHVEALTRDSPGVAAGLYRALARELSRRLRESSERIPPLMIEEIPQAAPPHQIRTGAQSPGAVPEAVKARIAGFKDAMAGIERAIKLGRAPEPGEASAPGAVDAACDGVRDLLDEASTADPAAARATGAYVFRETFPYFMASHYLDRCYVKPRGYAGDFETIDVVYRNEASGDGRLGPAIDRWALDSEPAEAVRHRRAKLGQILADLGRGERTAAVTSLACGPGREIFDALQAHPEAALLVTGIDIDTEAVARAAGEARRCGFEGRLRLAKQNVLRLSVGRGDIELPPQRLIYALGLVDYFRPSAVVQLLDWCFEALEEGGEVILGNFAASHRGRAFMDHVLEWTLIRRSPDEMRELFARSRFGTRPVTVESDPTGTQLYARCMKS